MSTGTISRLMKSQGFGFIKCSGGHEVFFHRSHVYGGAFELLAPGQNARFKVGIGTRGLQALDIRPLTEASTSGVKKPSQPTRK